MGEVLAESRRLGLLAMRGRAAPLHGSATATSAACAGTTVTLDVPIGDER
jgi:signal transduction histidine kinase